MDIDRVLSKKFGGKLTLAADVPVLSRIPTGIAGLDYITSGGFPSGRVAMLYGANGIGKTTLALELLKAFQTTGRVAYVDAEKTVTPNDFQRLGISAEDVIVLRPDYAEEALEFVLSIAEMGFKFVVVDSVPALLPKSKEERLEDNLAASDVGTQARFFSGIQPLLIRAAASGLSICFINQIRSNFNQYGPKTTTPGGQALPYICSLILELSSNKRIINEQTHSIRTRVVCIKNKGAKEHLATELEISGSGINRTASLFETLKDTGLVETRGAYYHLREDIAKALDMEARIAHGAEGFYQYLANPDNQKVVGKLTEALLGNFS